MVKRPVKVEQKFVDLTQAGVDLENKMQQLQDYIKNIFDSRDTQDGVNAQAKIQANVRIDVVSAKLQQITTITTT